MMKRWIIWGALALLIIALGAWAVSRMIARASAYQEGGQKSVSASVNLPPTDRMQQQLLNPQLDAASRESLMGKIEMAERVEQEQRAGETAPAPKVASEVSLQPEAKSLPEIESGIFPGSEGMIRPSQAQINNYWQGSVDGQSVMVFAGAAADNPNQGLVVVVTASLDPNVSDIYFVTVLAPGETGTLRVVDESDGLITLETPNGTKLMFNLSEKTFEP
jgi:hypothetical protein